ncbi:PAS domain S-box protein [Aerosakkonemataceae cyanobacterium BLCC-F50]|uniref:histidine kinase n=1 Tax=Floridaenema flaviceps BLCC-F50 TaxID=3153642 RepID=A0ABV4XZ27_9CYAN
MRSFIFPKHQRFFRKIPLHWVLVVPFVLQTVGAVGLVGYFSYRSGQEAVEDLAHRLLAQVSQRVSDRLDRYLQTSQQIVAINHLAVKQGSLNINDFEQLRQHLWQQMNLNPLLTSNSFWSQEGEAIGYIRFLSEQERDYASKLTGKNVIPGRKYFMKINKLNPSQRQFYQIDDRGTPKKLIYSTVDVDFQKLPWYRQVKAARKQIWSSIYVNRIIPLLQIQALAPVYNSAEKFQGTFKSFYFLSDLSSFLHQENFSRSGQVFIIERSGTLVASSSLEKLYVKSAKGEPKRLAALNSQDYRTREVAQKLVNRFGSFFDLRNPQELNLVTNNQRQFVQVTPYRDNYGLDWLIVLIVPESDFMGSINKNLWRTIWLCGLTFLGTSAAGIFSAYCLAKPIRRLSRISQELAAGNWQNVELEDSAIKEISVLAQSFNRTAQQLQQSFTQIKTALQESEARFTKIFRTCPDPISINQLGDGGKYIEVNDSFIQFCEYSREEIIGRTPEELNLSADLQQNVILWEELQKYGRIESFEFHYRTKSGKLGTALLSIELVELDGQQRVLTISKDISDRKQLELALQASQAQINDIINSAIAAISSFRVSGDGNWEINYISAGCEFISGYTPAQLQADKNLWVSRIFPGDWEAIESQVFADIFAQQTGTYEYRLYHKNGSLRWISQTNNSRWDATLNCWILTSVSLDITDRKQAEERLSKTEKWLRHYSNQSPSSIYTLVQELDGRVWFEYSSSAVEAIHELTFQQIRENPQTLFDQFHPDDVASYTEAAARSKENLELFSHEWRIITPSGKVKWLQANSQPEKRSNGTIAWHGVITDITDRKQAQEDLRQSEERFQKLAAASPGVIYTVIEYPSGPVSYEYVSPAFEEIHEIPVAEVLQDATITFNQIHPDDREGYQQAVKASLETGKPFKHEWRIITPSLKIKWIQASSRPERRKNGEVAWHGVVLDITDRKQAQEALRQSEERFQEIAHTVNQFFFVRSTITGEYLYVSPAYEKIWHRPCENLYQNPDSWLETIHPDDRELVLASIKQQCLEQSKREYRIIRPDGEIRWISTDVSLVKDEAGKPLRVVGLAEDITDRKQAEEKLRKTEQWLNQFSNSSPSVIYTLVREANGLFRFEYMSYACETINEVTAEQALNDAELILQMNHPDDDSGYKAAVIHSAETLELFSYQLRIITPSLKIKWLQVTSQPERRTNGAIAWHGVVLDITEQKQTEQALQQALGHINTHFDECPLAIVQWDRDFRIIRWSKQAERILGWTAQEVKTESPAIWKFIYEEDINYVNAELAPLIDGLVTGKAIQNRNYTKDGRVIVCQWYSSAVFDPAGNLVSVLSFAQDITDRQKIEAALRESEQTNRALVQSIPDLLIRMNRDGTYLDVRTSEEVKLINPQKIQPGANVFDALPQEIAQERFSFIQTTLATGEVQIQEYQLEIDGEIYYEEARIVPCGVDDVLIIVRDVSDRKRIEAALRESEERFRRAFDDAAIGMALVALDGRFLQVNHALCEITGYSETELLGNFFSDITHSDDLDADLEYMRQVLAGERRTYQMEKRYIHKSGHFVWCLLSISIVKDRQGNYLYFVGQVQDISERHKIDRIKDEFISIVSHELRTPLTAIRGSLGILETGVLDNRPEKAKYMLQVAVKNSDRLVRLVNDILDLERLQSGKFQLFMENCQVEDIMQQAVESVQAIANEAQIKINVTPLVAEIWASTDAIIQALTNLLSNAIKFSPAHSTIWLSAECRIGEPQTQENPTVEPPLSTPYILFQVRDSGRGIPADKLETIFGRFQQVDISDSRQKGGTGLGLAICKSIVQQHGGKIWVESILGQGSIFYFTLPIQNIEL